MKILVTGGAGYKGTKLVSALLRRGHTVKLLDNFMFGYQPVLHLVSEENLDIVQKDVRNLEPADVAGYDAIYHLAGISGMPACAANPHAAEMINVEATRKLCEMLDKTQLLIYASTTSFYGASGAGCDELTKVEPVSIYGRTKYQGEVIAQQRENSISLRFATVFGLSPKMRTDLLVNDFTYRAVHERSLVIFAGQSKRTFIHIEDAISAYLFALDHAATMRNAVYNVGGEHLNYSKLDIADAIQRHVSFERIISSLPDLDVRNFAVSFDRLNALGYRVRNNLDDGVLELVKLYRFYNNGNGANRIV